jgi:hypothetical protein
MVSYGKSIYKFTKHHTEGLLVYETKPDARYSKSDHMKLLLTASLVNGFAEGVSHSLCGTPTGETLLSYIKSQRRNDVQSAFDAMTERNIRQLKRERKLCKAVPIAIDWHDNMYYGDPKTPMIIGTKPNKGSYYAYEYLTASVLVNGERIVVAVTPIHQRADVQMLTMQMLERIDMLGIKMKYVTMDGGFFGTDVISYLEHMEINYVLRMHNNIAMRRRKPRKGQRFRYTTSYSNKSRNQQASFDVVVAFDRKKKRRHLFATNMLYSDDAILELFRKRWGIETSYRMCNQFLIKTTSRDYTVRLFYYLFACLVYNAWVLYNDETSCPVIQMKLALLGLVMKDGRVFDGAIP